MNIRISLICTLVMAIFLTACAPVQVPATPTLTVTPIPTKTSTPIPTLTPIPSLTLTPTSTPIPPPELTKEYKHEYGIYQFRYPEGWKTLDKYGGAFVLPKETADRANLDNLEDLNIYAFVQSIRPELQGRLITDARLSKTPEDIFELWGKSEEFEQALEENPGESSNFEINGYPAYEITAKGNDGQWYVTVVLAEELGLAIRFFGYSAAEDWQETLPYFMAIARSITLEMAVPIDQTDPSLEGLVFPDGAEDFAEKPYVNVPYGFQFQYPQEWVVVENPVVTMISPDKEHTTCYLVEGMDSDKCGTPLMVAAVAGPELSDFLRQSSFTDPEDVNEIWNVFDELVLNLGPTTYDFEPIERFEINGYEAIGLRFSGGYQKDLGDLEAKANPVMGYILAVKDGDRATVLFSMVPIKFWGQFRVLYAAMLESFQFTSGPLPPTPTPTPTATFIPAPANQTPTAGGFMYDGMNLQIPHAELAYDCYKAFRKAYPEETHGLPNFDQPGGTYCLLVVVSTISGQEPPFDLETQWDKLSTFTQATMIDQAQNSYSPDMDGMHGFGDRAWTNLYFFVDPSATSFKLHLPDGREIPISPASQTTLRLPAASPIPTFTPLPNPEAYTSATPQPSDRKFIDEHGVEMVFIPAGAFQMGRSEAQSVEACTKLKEQNCSISIVGLDPEHTVTLDAFYMDVLEVTNARYTACVAAGVCVPPGSNQSATRSSYYGNPKFDDYPVVFVDWAMARTYCQWRNGDLPTEAQWEKAARGTDDRWFPWGDDLDGKYANFNDVNSSTDGGRKDLNDGYADTAPANSFPEGASPYGILNLAGNVWEWVLDDYSAVFYEKSPRNNPIALNQTGNRVIRGGSWSAFSVYTLWVSYRDRSDPRDWDYMTGFRCARSP